MKFNERRVGFEMGLLSALLVVFATMNMGASDKIKEGFWENTKQRIALVEVRNGSTNTWAKEVFVAERPTNVVYHEVPNFSATTRAIIVDLSDTSGYAHGDTGFIAFHDVNGTICIDGATGKWNIRFGVVGEIDASNGTVYWFWGTSLSGAAETCAQLTYRPLPTMNMVLSGQTPTDWATGKIDAGSSNWQSDVAIPTFIGGSTAPGVGDVVTEIEEVDDNSNLDVVGIQIKYKSYSGG
jgi:hypothetical protein